MDGGDFVRMTLSSQRAIIEQICLKLSPGEPLFLIGSSMGGYLAALTASAREVRAMVLLAPAVDFAQRWRERLGPARVAAWRERGVEETFHYAQQRQAQIGYGLLEDADRHAPWPRVACPTLVFHGVQDDVVPQDRVERWVAQTPSATLELLETGHEMTDQLEHLWARSWAFFAPFIEAGR